MTGQEISNPILPGFNPDPSICRVGDDYYIATSTFEWYPGVQIHHSRNLRDWSLITRPLRRASQLDMRGEPDSCGVWAPCLSYANDQFWLVYTDVRRFDGNFKDAHNYLVTSPDIRGDWSDPIFLNSSGFDPSLFHDDDGCQYLLNLVWNYRATSLGQSPRHSPFGGIAIQAYSHQDAKLSGDSTLIYTGTERGLTEGPHLFKHDDYYYLVTAEGGTGYEHAVTHARSRSLLGPYKTHPDQHLMLANPSDSRSLQRTGHGQVVQTSSGEWYHTHLCSRPLTDIRRSPLGRETGIQRCTWGDDGWLRLADGSQQAASQVRAPIDSELLTDPGSEHAAHSHTNNRGALYLFTDSELPMDFQWLRTPYPERLYSLSERPGYLRLFGRESIGSWFEQALIARRLQHFTVDLSTELSFSPTSFLHAAGLVVYYNRHKFHYLYVSHDEELGPVLSIMSCPGNWPEGALHFPVKPIPLDSVPVEIELGCRIDESVLQFSWRQAENWQSIGPVLDASVLSDEGGRGEHASFTGCFVGMMAFDTSGHATPADFRRFEYRCSP